LNHTEKQDAPAALVTGAAKRIGAEIVKQLHQAGFRVAIHCHRSVKEANALAAQLNDIRNNSATVLVADLAIKTSIMDLIPKALDWAGGLHLLVNNASLFAKTSTKPLDEKTWDDLFTINVKAPFWLSHQAFPALSINQGAIINITDIHSEKPLKGYSAYCQTKAALTMQTKSLAREFAPRVRVNAIAPGAIAWPLNDNELSIELQAGIIEKTPLKRHGCPLDVAKALLALVDNSFITGQVLAVDGGRGII